MKIDPSLIIDETDQFVDTRVDFESWLKENGYKIVISRGSYFFNAKLISPLYGIFSDGEDSHHYMPCRNSQNKEEVVELLKMSLSGAEFYDSRTTRNRLFFFSETEKVTLPIFK